MLFVLDFPTPPSGHKHERIHRHMFWPNSIDPSPEEQLKKVSGGGDDE